MADHIYTYIVRLGTGPQPNEPEGSEVVVRAKSIGEAISIYLAAVSPNIEATRIEARKVNGQFIA